VRVLLAGSTGYIGGRLVPLLLEQGHQVRCLARNPGKLDASEWRDSVEVLQGDVLDIGSLRSAAKGCDSAVYLVHSLEAPGGVAETDRAGAANFRDAADEAGIKRIVYLSGLGTSKHLASRHEAGAVLASGKTPVTEVRAGVVIGSGSLSFEMLRYLTEVLPVMTTPRWVRTLCQPIAVRDILEILGQAVSEDSTESHVIEAGGPDILTYQKMMQVYAEEAGLRKRLIVPVPVLSPGLSSLWVGLVTPLPPRTARALISGLCTEVVVSGRPAAEVFPHRQTPYREAVSRALVRTAAGPETRWSDAGPGPAQPTQGDPRWSGGAVYEDVRVVPTDASPAQVYWAFSRIGGDVGYYSFNWAWAIRGLMDQVVGGVGLRRGRRHPEDLHEGEAVDFWRVDRIESERLLRLHAEMKLPGEAWLEWQIQPTEQGSDLIQRARFRPRGILGRLYWYSLWPFHRVIFPRMVCRIAATAEERGYSCAS